MGSWCHDSDLNSITLAVSTVASSATSLAANLAANLANPSSLLARCTSPSAGKNQILVSWKIWVV